MERIYWSISLNQPHLVISLVPAFASIPPSTSSIRSSSATYRTPRSSPLRSPLLNPLSTSLLVRLFSSTPPAPCPILAGSSIFSRRRLLVVNGAVSERGCELHRVRGADSWRSAIRILLSLCASDLAALEGGGASFSCAACQARVKCFAA